jgi:kynurenine formamidase
MPNRLVSVRDFDRIFESVKTWGRWGPDDQQGTLNYITPYRVRDAACLARSGRRVSLALDVNTIAGPDNQSPAIHLMTRTHDADVDGGPLRFAADFLGFAFHGDSQSHVDALCHVSYNGQTYGGRDAASVVTSVGATTLDISASFAGLVGRGVLLDLPHYRGVDWLEPGEAVTADELTACADAADVDVGEGDILVFRTGHHRRRLELGAWNVAPPPDGEGKAGLHVDAVEWMAERRVAAFLTDGDGEASPSCVDGMNYPIHALQIAALGMLTSDNLQLEDVSAACREEGTYEFMVVGLPLRLRGGTGSPWNPIAIF